MSKVELVNCSSSFPALDIVEAFRKCYKSEAKSDSHRSSNLLGPKDKTLLENGIINGHLTPYEFVDFTFDIKLSRAAHTQLVRHRMSSFCAESGRHCRIEEFFMPKTIAKHPDFEREYIDMFWACHRFHNRMISAGIPLEDARYIIPMAATSEIRYKANLHSLRNAIAERTCVHAHAEIREIFLQIKAIIKTFGSELMFRVEKIHRCEKQCGGCL